MATTSQGYIAIPNAPYCTTFSGGVFAEKSLKSQTTPSAVGVDGHLFRIDHVGIGVADAATGTLENGFKLDYVQLPCNQASKSITV